MCATGDKMVGESIVLTMDVEKIEVNNQVIAILVRSSYKKTGIQFFTNNDSSQQLGYMNRPTGYVISPRIRRAVERKIADSQNVLIVRSGKVRVDLFDDNAQYLESRVLSGGDVILLAAGGHGFEILDQAELIEVKQGPYTGEEDLIRFEPTQVNIVIKE